MLFDILEKAVVKGASDIHLTKGMRPVVRIRGKLIKLYDLKELNNFNLLSIREDIIRNFSDKKDQTINYKDNRFRIHMYRQKKSYAFAIRILSKEIAGVEELGLPKIVSKFPQYKDGMIIISGSTGSGKSTSLAAILESINTMESRHILTLEDPIEYVYENKKSIINQREIGIDVSTYEEGILDALREDIDMVMIGELRDLNSVKNTLTLSETGHLVLTTLHSKSSIELISRIIDLFPSNGKDFVRGQLANSLRAVVCQELIKTRGGDMIPLCEVMIVNRAIKNIIRGDGNLSSIEDQIYMGKRDLGCQTREQALVDLVVKNKLNLEEALVLSNNTEKLKKLLIHK